MGDTKQPDTASGRDATIYHLSGANASRSLQTCPRPAVLGGGDSFVLEPHALASMLFDCDLESSVEIAPVPLPINQTTQVNVPMPIQKIKLASIRFDSGAQGILANVTGKWSGAIYYRAFESADGRPLLVPRKATRPHKAFESVEFVLGRPEASIEIYENGRYGGDS
jgi:hypothetical protein